MDAAKTPGEKPPRAARNRSRTTGGTKVRTAAEKALREKADTIMTALAKSAEKGNLQCFKVLYELTKENEERGEGGGKTAARSRAAEWATEQEWTAPEDGTADRQQQQPDN